VGFLRNVVTAFKPSSIARGLDAARNPPDQAAIEASLVHLSPEQRAAYEANMARVRQGEAESQAAYEEARAISEQVRVLEGPAGRYLHGMGVADAPSPEEIQARMMTQGVLPTIGELRASRKGEFKQGVRQSFGIQEVKQAKDPAERAEIAARERAARDAARAPYRSPQAVAVTISRLATRGRTQLAEVLAHLHASGLAARPDHVFGVYRVPDRISGPVTPQSEQSRVVEWDVVHLADDAAHADAIPPAAALPPLVATSFRGAEQWVARRLGEPSIVDEDLALAFCQEAGIGPERCAGLARISEFRAVRGDGSDDGASVLHTLVQGVVAIHPEDATGAFERFRAAAPIPLPLGPPAGGVHVEVLNWEAIGRAVHLKVHHPPPAPSPFPYLPATPQELLRSYLEIVGLHPSDCYSAQATVDHPFPLVQGGFFSTNVGPKQPCADGQDRMRTRGCEEVVVVYRDRPEYVAGRERWGAYAADVLQARLHNGLGLRPPLTLGPQISELPRILRPVAHVSDAIDWFETLGVEELPAYRYCWPAIDQAG